VTVSMPSLDELLGRAQRRALHLELRDVYAGSVAYKAWLDGTEFDRRPLYAPWIDRLAPLVSAGADIRRARVVSEPVTTFIRFEYAVTPEANLAAGERVRWVPRRAISTVAVPGNDFWLVDDVVLFNIFSGDGEWIDTEVVRDAAAVLFCERSFAEVWERGVDHADYEL
jgi:hypothetical protein